MSHIEADLDGERTKCFQCPENFGRAGDLCYSIKTIQEMLVQREGIVFYFRHGLIWLSFTHPVLNFLCNLLSSLLPH